MCLCQCEIFCVSLCVHVCMGERERMCVCVRERQTEHVCVCICQRGFTCQSTSVSDTKGHLAAVVPAVRRL